MSDLQKILNVLMRFFLHLFLSRFQAFITKSLNAFFPVLNCNFSKNKKKTRYMNFLLVFPIEN